MSWVFFCFIEPLHVISSNWRRFLTFFLHTVGDWGVVERFANYEVSMCAYTRILTPALPQNTWKKLEQETKSKISQILVSAVF